MSSAWRAELFWLILIALITALVARLTRDLGLALSVCTLAYLGRHLFYANRLLHWLRTGKSGQLPEADGVWEEIYYLIFRVRSRNKRRKKQLLRMLDRFRTATSALPDATVVLGTRNEIQWFNESATQLLGLRKTDVGQQINNLVRSPKFSQYLGHGDQGTAIDLPSPTDGNKELEVRVVPYGDDDSHLLVARDITQLRLMERVRSDFVANVSHELRTPITVLRGYIEALVDSDEALPEHHRRILSRVEEQTTRMQNLIDGLLVLTRLESSRERISRQPIQIAELLRSVCEDAELIAEERPELELLIESPVDVCGVEQELRSAFSNLVANALKYTPVEGKVTVRWREYAGGVRLDVKDTGPGIAPEHLSRLTERFYRVNVEGCRNKSGSGLGLAIAKHVLTRHDATLEITSTLGDGSCFSCCFPETRVVRLPAPRLIAPPGDDPMTPPPANDG